MANYINVHLHRGKSGISHEKEWYDVYTMEPFENNKANRDIINQLSKYFNIDYRILALEAILLHNNLYIKIYVNI